MFHRLSLCIRTDRMMLIRTGQLIIKIYTLIYTFNTNFVLGIGFRHGHPGSQSSFGLVQSGFGFSGLSKSASFGLYEISVQDRFGFYRVRVGVSKSSKNRYNPMYFRVRVPIGSSV